MRYIIMVLALFALASEPAKSADFMLCTVEKTYEFSKAAAIEKNSAFSSDLIGGKFRFDRISGTVNGELKWAGVKWTLVERWDSKNSWMLTASDAKSPLRFTLTIQTWVTGYPFILYDVALGDSNTGTCH